VLSVGLVSAVASAQTGALLHNGIQIGDGLFSPAIPPGFDTQPNDPDVTNCSGGCVFQTHGLAPAQIAFDGTNFWVTNSNSNDVTKIRPRDGKVLGIYPTGKVPTGIVFDGKSIWIANWVDGTLTNLSLSGQLLGTYPVGSLPYGLAVDSSGNLWVGEEGTGNFVKVTNGTITITVAVKWSPYLMVSDGTYIWGTNSEGYEKINPATGTFQAFTTGLNVSTTGITFDGHNIWVMDINGDLFRISDSTGAVLDSYTTSLQTAQNLWSDGTFVWATGLQSNNVARVQIKTGAISYVPITFNQPLGIMTIDKSVWVVNDGPGDGTVTKFPRNL
jgi:streptogramin lyase